MSYRFAPLAASLLVLGLFGCDDDGGGPGRPDAGGTDTDAGPGTTYSCVPSENVWESSVAAVVASNCGTCHGEEPDFGAPFSLTTYADLLVEVEGERIVDRMVTQVGAGLMPPIGAPDPTLAERDTIVQWASCGETRAMPPMGPMVSRPPFMSPTDAPAGLQTVDVTAEGYAVEADVRDRYVEFNFTNLVDEEMFIRRFEAIIDESRVLHHLTLQRRRTGSPMRYLYTWAPGTGPFEFPDGGIRLRPTDSLRLEVHYNNGAGLTGLEDSSGVRLYVDQPVGTEYLMADPGPGVFGFSVPARSDGTAEDTCTVTEDVTVLATMPHMHEVGTTFEILVDGEPQLTLDGWSFETQLFYEMPLELRAGQELTVRCGYTNMSSEIVRAGLRTEDEMCFAFTYITPALENFCN